MLPQQREQRFVNIWLVFFLDFHNEIIKFIQYFSLRSDFHFTLRSDNPRKKRFRHLNAYVNGICVVINIAYPYIIAEHVKHIRKYTRLEQQRYIAKFSSKHREHLFSVFVGVELFIFWVWLALGFVHLYVVHFIKAICYKIRIPVRKA